MIIPLHNISIQYKRDSSISSFYFFLEIILSQAFLIDFPYEINKKILFDLDELNKDKKDGK